MFDRIALLLFIGLIWGQSKTDINNLIDRVGLIYKANDDKLYTGSVFDFYENGQKKINGRYRNGIKNGKWTWWNMYGGIDSVGSYKNGLMNGLWQYYYINGNPKAKGLFRNGIGTDHDQIGLPQHGRHGKWTFWYEDGLKHIDITYKNGNELNRKIIFERMLTAVQLLELSNENLKNYKTDLAVSDLITLIEKYPQDSLASQAQYKLASIHLNWENDLSAGYYALQNTVTKYENSIQAKQAQIEINEFPEYIINKAESLRKRKMIKEAVDHLMYMTEKYSQHESTPKGQYMLGDIYMNDFRDFTTAIQEYRKVVEKYGGSPQEPHAFFMIGYIYANVMNDAESALIEYYEFLKRFPKHELAPSVKFEIEFLGKSIHKIPALKHITN